MKCKTCQSSRLLSVSGKVSDRCYLHMEDVYGDIREYSGYVPGDLNIGSDDYLEFTVCLSCGQMQGDYPLTESQFECDINL